MELNITNQLQIIEICKDCVFGKIHIWPYSNKVVYKKKILECVHVDV